MKTVETKNGTTHVCDTCGKSHRSKSLMEQHEQILPDHTVEETGLSVGDVVEHKGGRHTVTQMRHVQSRQPLLPNFRTANTHQLVLELSQSVLPETRKLIPFNPKIGSGRAFLEISYNDYLLWQEGDEEKLVEARLLRKPPEKKPGVFRRTLSALGL